MRTPRVVTVELDPVNAVVAKTFLLMAGLSADVEVWPGGSAGVADELLARFGPGSVAMLFMDHRGSLFHEDLRSFEDAGLLADGAAVVADNVLKPGAPQFLWLASRSRSLEARFLQVPEFGLGHQALEDWMAVCRFRARAGGALGPEATEACPAAVVRLARRCDEMRRLTLVRRGGVGMAEWAAHSAETKAALQALGIGADVPDLPLMPG
ncbi:unnamed protein product [Prorocentrum cordatum]|uniref:catechol O-methyltransferase n=1 Tax=Prorocentrum cordatum TaxID=2364126 RepID=A0ABN9PCE3_9DINO|nr:unnamed protein product [Polarella glacialis]